jgi:hypothetical protein
MSFAGVNYLPIVIAAIVTWLAGASVSSSPRFS